MCSSTFRHPAEASQATILFKFFIILGSFSFHAREDNIAGGGFGIHRGDGLRVQGNDSIKALRYGSEKELVVVRKKRKSEGEGWVSFDVVQKNGSSS